MGEDYGTVTVKMDFQRFASVEPVFKGEQIIYGLTIPSNAPHPEQAMQFIEFLYGPEGRAIMEKNAHPMLLPAVINGEANLPERLRNFFQ